MTVTLPDFVGFIGVALICSAYGASQLGRMEATAPLYSALNGIGAALILFSLCFAFNLASFVIEFFWLIISVAGLWRALKRSKTNS
jgi:hypothetical protein